MNIEVDHVYIFTGAGAMEVSKLIEAGFFEGPRRVHEGQGTSNVCFFFRNLYLEFIWVHNDVEARQSDKELYERSLWKQNDHCPFGIAFRTNPENAELPNNIKTWNYNPAYMPNGASIRNVENMENYGIEPDFFILPFSRKVPDNLKAHKNGVTDIVDINILSPHCDRLSVPAKYFQGLGLISFQENEGYLMEIRGNSPQNGNVLDLRPSIPLKIYY